jgi:hypothetical protein
MVVPDEHAAKVIESKTKRGTRDWLMVRDPPRRRCRGPYVFTAPPVKHRGI